MTGSDIGIGLIGAGEFGRRLGHAVRRTRGLSLSGIVDADPAAGAAAGRELEATVFEGLDTLLGDPGVRAVIVATPHGTHTDIAIRAVDAGRHVFVEKPLAVTVADCRRIIEAADGRDLTLLVGHITRLLPVVRRALDLLDAGTIGEPLAAWALRHQPLRREGWFARRNEFGTLLHSPAIHNLDLLNRILGRAASVSALAARPVQTDLEYPDIMGLLIGYEGGRVATLGATVSDPLRAPMGTSSARIVGSRGGLAFDVATGIVEVRSTDGDDERIEIRTVGWGLDEALDEELANFAASIRGDAEPFVAPGEALRAVELCEAADRSIATGQPVALPLDR